VRAVTALGRRAPDAQAPRLNTFQDARKALWEVYRAEPEPAVAGALAAVHREIHALLKPDELARADATKKYRADHLPHNRAAEAIVHYPTDPSGADRK
jgi:hypothetical protein